MPIERHALYFYNVASTSEQPSTSASIPATCTCRVHVPRTCVAASSSKTLGKSPMVTWKLAAPSIKSIAGQQYEMGYPAPVAPPISVKGDDRRETPWHQNDGSEAVRCTPSASRSTSISSSSSALDSPMSRSSSSASIASLAHSEVSTISSYTSCSSLLDMDETVSIPPQAASKKPLPSPSCERPPSAMASPLLPTRIAVAIAPHPAQPDLDSILVAQTVQWRSTPDLAPTSKGMPFIPEDISPKSPTLAIMPDVFEMNSRTSTLLRIDGFKARVGAILEDFEIFPQARKDFIDYWYTRFKDQEYLAVRFLTSKEYSALLPLHITSSSQFTIQRLFAIFKRVTHDEAKHWFSSRLRIDSQKIDWKERVRQTVSEVVPKSVPSSSWEGRRSRRTSTNPKESSRRVRIDTSASAAMSVKASLLELGAMELSVEAGIGRFFFV